MDSIISQINRAVGKTTDPITQSASSAVSASNKLAQTIGVGKLGVSPIPLPFPNTGAPYNSTHFVCPLSLSLESNPNKRLRLPCDPLIAVSGGNSVVMKEVANSQITGTIKEFWKNDDFSINISGILMTDEMNDLNDLIKQLTELLTAKEALVIENDLLGQLGITRIVVESFSFPATEGEENQFFTITASSDDSYNLIID